MIINDFSYYPGFQDSKKKKYKKQIKKDYEKVINSSTNNMQKKEKLTFVWEVLQKDPILNGIKVLMNLLEKLLKKVLTYTTIVS